MKLLWSRSRADWFRWEITGSCHCTPVPSSCHCIPELYCILVTIHLYCTVFLSLYTCTVLHSCHCTPVLYCILVTVYLYFTVFLSLYTCTVLYSCHWTSVLYCTLPCTVHLYCTVFLSLYTLTVLYSWFRARCPPASPQLWDTLWGQEPSSWRQTWWWPETTVQCRWWPHLMCWSLCWSSVPAGGCLVGQWSVTSTPPVRLPSLRRWSPAASVQQDSQVFIAARELNISRWLSAEMTWGI